LGELSDDSFSAKIPLSKCGINKKNNDMKNVILNFNVFGFHIVANGKHMHCGGLSKTNLSVHDDLYLKLKYSFS
jgi:hypothetical protein